MAAISSEQGVPSHSRQKSRVLVAMNYILVAVILLGIGAVLFKGNSASQPVAITGSAPVDIWCQTHAGQKDCRADCTHLSFDAYTQCTAECFKRLDACRQS